MSSSRRPGKRALILDDDDQDEDIYYIFKVLLPNSTSVNLTLPNPGHEMPMDEFVKRVKEEYDKSRKDCVMLTKRTRVDWSLGGKFYIDSNGEKMKGTVRFAAFKPNICHIIRLDDGSGITSTMYENLWDLTPDTDLLKELPENYSFETALADLIDNSLQAVWSRSKGERSLISVDVSGDRITVFDTGSGMEISEANSIDKWGKIGASLHRSHKSQGIGGNPPYLKGKESIDKILEKLEEEGCKVSESFQNFGRVSIRRLGHLLPEVRWQSIPFMQRGARGSTLQKGCQRVKCFVDLDAGFSPTPSKTNLASQNPFSVALRNFGSKSTEKEKDNDVHIDTHREGKPLNYQKLEHAYQEWVLEMHNTHDEEAVSGEDEATLIVGELDKKALVITHDAVRVHKVMKRKEKLWKRGQKIKILKGAYAGVHNNNVYATIDYFLIEGFEDEVGGDTRILCRPINIPEKEGCTHSIIDGISQLDLRSSLSLPITIIDSGKCLPVDKDEWNKKLEKQQEKAPSRIDLLDESDCRVLNIDGELPVGDSVRAGRAPPQQIVAVLRPACFTSSTPSKKLEQKHIVKDGEEMLMVVKLQDKTMKSSDKNGKPVCTQRLLPTSRKGIHGLYIFSLGSKFPDLFKKAGTYNFCFSIGNSITCKKTVVVRSSSKAAKWKLDGDLESMLCDVKVGSCLPPFCIGCFDDYDNRIPFTSVPSLEVELVANPGFHVKIDKFEANLINSGSILKIKNMLVETDGLDQIRSNYEATLEIRAKDKPFSVSVACDVNPGPLERVVGNNPQALENLLPGSTVEDFILEMFDGYNNHVREGTSVVIGIDGFRIEDWMGVNRKVDDRGCIDLSGILKVIEGYGKSVSISVISGKEEIFRKESQIEERELRLETELPSCCAAGSNLENLNFKVTDSDGAIDTSIHHDEKCGCFHTMRIESDSSSFDGIRYAFVHGSCKVPSLPLPEDEGVVAFRVYHSRYPELQMSFKIQLTPALAMKKATWTKDAQVAAVEATKAVALREAELQTQVEKMNALIRIEKLKAVYLSKASVEYETKVQEANWELYNKQKQAEAVLYQKQNEAEAQRAAADAAFYSKQKEAEGLVALGSAQGTYLRTLLGAVQNDYSALRDFLMINNVVYQEIAKTNAIAVRDLQPKISVWNKGGEQGISGGGGAMKDIAGLYKMLPPVLYEQTGMMQPPAWIGTLPGAEAAPKILVCGDPCGRLNELFNRVQSITNSVGPFDALLCVGQFFPDSKDSEESVREFMDYVDGPKLAPIRTYFTGDYGLTAPVIPRTLMKAENQGFTMDGLRVSPNLFWLRGSGMFKLTSRDKKGLSIAYLSGRRSFPQTDVDLLRALAKRYGVVDLFLTNEWPVGVRNRVAPSCSNTTVSELVMDIKPRYHIAGSMGLFYDRPPYLNADSSHVTRFIGLAQVGNINNQEYIHGLSIMSPVGLQPPNLTQCPYPMKRSNDNEPDPQYSRQTRRQRT